MRVFSATLADGRASLGERVSAWLADSHDIEIVDICVTQSSDARFHCYTMTVFYGPRRDAHKK